MVLWKNEPVERVVDQDRIVKVMPIYNVVISSKRINLLKNLFLSVVRSMRCSVIHKRKRKTSCSFLR